MKMGTWSLSKWLPFALVLLAVIHSGGAASKCHFCPEDDPSRCTEFDCGGDGWVCTATRYNDDGPMIKECDSDSFWDDMLGGKDTCRTGSQKDFKEKEFDIKFVLDNSGHGKEGEKDKYVKEEWEKFKKEVGSKNIAKKMTVCSCSTDLCNSDDHVKELMEKNKDKMLDTRNAGTTLFADSGNLGVVMFLALAVSVALIPGSGFLGSQ